MILPISWARALSTKNDKSSSGALLMSSEDEMRDKDMVGGCCVCSDERGWDENPLVYCDGQGCNVAVHQACYGIVTVPSGPWFCKKCESQERAARVKCDLCPSRDGALKRTDQNGWAHVVCALYIPEVRFGNVTTMEPILISLIPAERFGRTCYICETNGRGSKATAGACMQCNKVGCKAVMHVTCSQMQGLLCEEAGNMDNVKYCGYCQYHYSKLKTSRNVKIIPPFRPVPNSSSGNNANNADSPGSSPEKGGGSSSKPSSTDEKLASLGGTSNNSISPDIDSSSKNSKIYNKKSSGSHFSSGSKSSDGGSISSKSNNGSITPILTPATFSAVSSSHASKNSVDGKDVVDDKSIITEIIGNTTTSQSSNNKKSGKEGEMSLNSKDDSVTVKFERVDNPLLVKGSASSKKDFSALQLKEVVTTALDRPMSNTKYDQAGGGIATSGGGIDPPSSNTGGGGGNTSSTSSSHSSSRHSHHGSGGGEKPAPPDIKPHVTLTPIPMRGSTSSSSSSRISLTRVDSEDRGEDNTNKDKDSSSKNKSPSSSSMQFHSSSSFGQKMADPLDNTSSKLSKHSASDINNSSNDQDKSAPPAKRSRGTSRDDDRGRKTPTKGRGGRPRGSSSHGSGYGKRDTYNNMDENSNEPMDTGNSNSSRGGRNGPAGRKPGGSRLMGRSMGDDPPAPTLSQLKAQMESANGGVGDNNSGGSGTSVGVLPTHMFGNALNPASSMAQRMVDTLSQEMEAVAAAGAVGIPDIVSQPTPVVGIQLPGKSAMVNGSVSTNSTTTSSSSGSAPPQTLEQLLERQWEQGSQFLMEQAQHLDIAQLLSCLNQLKQDNRALEEHVQTLVQRRDQLIAINARLSIPLGNSSALGPVFNNNTVNGTVQNGHGTPPPPSSNNSAQIPNSHPNNLPKGLQVNSSTPSPQHHQQHNELMMQATRHGHRGEERIYHSEMQVSRAEISVAHPTSSPHGQGQQQQQSISNRQNVAPYGYHPSGGGPLPPHHSHHQQQQPPSSHHQHGNRDRDGTR